MRGMPAPLRSLWNAPGASPRPPVRVWRDWALVGVLVPLAVMEGVLRHDLARPLFAVTVAIVLIPTLLWRRTHPLLMIAIAIGVSAAVHLVLGPGSEPYTMGFVLLLVYSVFRWGNGRALIFGSAILVTSMLASLLHSSLADVVGALAVVSVTLALGLAFRYRAGLRERELDGARLREREEFARDLHDTVAHHVSAIAIQAQAGLATAASRPEAATVALGVIELEASRTLAEMRAMVGVLRRDGAADLAPAKRVADVESLASSRPGEAAVEVHITGAVDAVSAATAAAVYRIAQESITNARRHARHATLINVTISVESGAIRLDVHDDGDPSAAAEPGLGITGMVERATLLGGSCVAGRSTEGWTVTAVLPLTGRAR